MPSRLKSLKEEDTRQILSSVGQGLVSIYAPMQPAGTGVQQNRLRWKKISKELKARLEDRGLESAQLEQITNRVDALVDAKLFWRKQTRGLACFVTPDTFRCFQMRRQPKQSLSIDRRFNVRPLLEEINRDYRFYVLADMDDCQLRLVQVDGGESEGLSHELPITVGQVLKGHQLQKSQTLGQFECGDGNAECPIHPGNAPVQQKPNRPQISELGRQLQQQSNSPLFFAGSLEKFRELSAVIDCQNLQSYRIRWNSETPWDQVVREGTSRVEALRQHRIEQLLETYKNWQDSDWATDQVPEIYRGSLVGQVKHLLVSDDYQCYGHCSADGQPEFANSNEELKSESDADLANLLINTAIQNGGTVYSIPSRMMPPNTGTLALFGRTESLGK